MLNADAASAAEAMSTWGDFGSSWPALGECVADMEWLLPAAGIVGVVRNAAEVLVHETPEELNALVHVIRSASQESRDR